MFILNNCTSQTTACPGIIGANGIPGDIVSIIHYLYLAIQVAVPVILIIFGMIELAKALTTSKDDEIKKAQNSLLKKCVVAIVVFLVFSLTRFVFNFANSSDDAESLWGCVDAIINADCKGVKK